MHEGSKHLDVVDSIIATAITCESDGSEGLSSKDRVDLSKLYLKVRSLSWNHIIQVYKSHLSRGNPLN